MANKNIVTEPTSKMNSFTIKFKVGKKSVKVDFFANIASDEIMAVFNNWTARTEEYTSQSLVNYINSKSHYGFKATL